MPTIGPFHRFYWKARANTPAPPGTNMLWMYPQWQSVIASRTMGVLFGALQPLWERVVACVALLRTLWTIRAYALWAVRVMALSVSQRVALGRVFDMLESPLWEPAQAAVLACAHTPKFHQPEQWVAYGRAIKANPGQAQNVYRHLKAVHEVRGLQDGGQAISNPDAHLVVELAYQAYAALGHPDRRLVMH